MTKQQILDNQPIRKQKRALAWILLFTSVWIWSTVWAQFLVYEAPIMKAKSLAVHYNPNEKVDEAQRYLLALKQR